MSPNTRLYLVRHAESAPSPDLPEPEWPLSDDGRVQAEALVPTLAKLDISAAYSSPYPRAVDTVLDEYFTSKRVEKLDRADD